MAQEADDQSKCWRCGMLLPQHELQLLDNQWHCAYCLMDVQMERQEVARARQAHSRERAEGEDEVPHGGGHGPERMPAIGPGGQMNCEACGRSLDEGAHRTFAGKIVCGSCYLNESRLEYGGYCMRCGREVQQLLSLGGEQLCEECFLEASGKGAPGWTNMIKTLIGRVFGVKPKRGQRRGQGGRKGARADGKGDKPEPSARENFNSAKDAGELGRQKGQKKFGQRK